MFTSNRRRAPAAQAKKTSRRIFAAANSYTTPHRFGRTFRSLSISFPFSFSLSLSLSHTHTHTNPLSLSLHLLPYAFHLLKFLLPPPNIL